MWSPLLRSEAFQELLHDDPIVANVKDDEGLEAVLRSDRQVLFLERSNSSTPPSRLIAAEFTRMSRPPRRSRASLMTWPGASGVVRSICRNS